MLPYCDRVMLQLVQNLQSPEVHRNIKPQILSAFGDIALAIGDKFVVSLQAGWMACRGVVLAGKAPWACFPTCLLQVVCAAASHC